MKKREQYMYNWVLDNWKVGEEILKDDLRKKIEDDQLIKDFYLTDKSRKGAFISVLCELFNSGHARFVSTGRPLLVRIK